MFNYKNIYELGATSGVGGMRHQFRSVAREGFNVLDSPDLRYFKLLFYFSDGQRSDNVEFDINGNKTVTYEDVGSGLLVKDWVDGDTPTSRNFYTHNSAYAYLMNNLEVERADELKQFITLLSNISSNSPWYFKEVSGIDEALVRKDFKVPDERKKITITCMDDPIDHRISSLLSSYRSIVWSHAKKCEVLPANLRKFDMGIMIFSGLTVGPHVQGGGKTGETFDDGSWRSIDKIDNTIDSNGENVGIINTYALGTASNIFLEFHNCEIDIDSFKSGFDSFSNEDGKKQEFKIDILFDDCYEAEYNQFLLRSFGDFLLSDIGLNVQYEPSENKDSKLSPANIGVSTKFVDMLAGMEDDGLGQYYNDSIYPFGVNGSGSDNNPSMSWKDKAKKQFVDMGKGIAGDVADSAKRTTFNTADKATGLFSIDSAQLGLGNFYRESFLDTTVKNISNQAKQLAHKAIGNLEASATKIINTAENAINKTTGAITNIAADYIDDGLSAATGVVSSGVNAITNIADKAVNSVTSSLGIDGDLGSLLSDMDKEEMEAQEAERMAAYAGIESGGLGNMNSAQTMINNL